MQNDDIVLCQHCGEAVFYENTIESKNGLICSNCLDPIKYRTFISKQEEE